MSGVRGVRGESGIESGGAFGGRPGEEPGPEPSRPNTREFVAASGEVGAPDASAGRVLHAGQALVDLVLQIPAVPEVGGDVFARSFDLLAGGGFNVMAAAARDGAEVLYLGGHGTGPFGEIVRAALATDRIGVLAPADPRQDTGFCVALVDDAAERTFVSTMGAEGSSSREVFDSAGARSGDVVYVSGYSLVASQHRDVLLAWLATLPEGVLVVVDPGPLIGQIDEAVLAEVTARADLWSLNEREARILAGQSDTAAQRERLAGELAGELAARLGAGVVLRCGADGAVVAGGGWQVPVPAPAVEAVDTNGAGDAHCGVLCARLAAGASLLEAVERANHAAAIAVTRRGPATSPASAEIDGSLRSSGR